MIPSPGLEELALTYVMIELVQDHMSVMIQLIAAGA